MPKKQPGNMIKARLEYLRGELRAERISYGELAELQSLTDYIDPGDTELLEAAGVPAFPLLKLYHVTWEIELDAESPEDAARKALETLRNPESTATVFDVILCEPGELEQTQVDLWDLDEAQRVSEAFDAKADQSVVAKFVDRAAVLGLTDEDLDETVHDLHSKVGAPTGASEINNGGIEEQLAYLLSHLMPDEVETLLTEIAANK